MEAVITPLSDINFRPSNTTEEIIQNIKTILATIKGSVPLDREFGIDGNYLDEPTPIAQMYFRMAIVDAIEKYEPRAYVKSIEFKQSDIADGKLIPIVTVEIIDNA